VVITISQLNIEMPANLSAAIPAVAAILHISTINVRVVSAGPTDDATDTKIAIMCKTHAVAEQLVTATSAPKFAAALTARLGISAGQIKIAPLTLVALDPMTLSAKAAAVALVAMGVCWFVRHVNSKFGPRHLETTTMAARERYQRNYGGGGFTVGPQPAYDTGGAMRILG
jgi:hypothetical protein